MAKIGFSFNFPCPACGGVIRGQKEKREYQCKKCTRKFFIVFDRPDQAELEQAFLAGELRPNIFLRAPRPPQDSFPFDIFMKRKKHE